LAIKGTWASIENVFESAIMKKDRIQDLIEAVLATTLPSIGEQGFLRRQARLQCVLDIAINGGTTHTMTNAEYSLWSAIVSLDGDDLAEPDAVESAMDCAS